MPDLATDTSTATPPGGYDLVGDAQKGIADTSKSLADLTRGKIKQDDAIIGQTNERMAEDRGIAKEYFNREAASINDLHKWDQKQEAQKYAYDPIEAFGSIGSLFGIFASAFTKTPMENALNASSAAMNAIKSGKQDEYQNAFKAWKENNELAIKRGELMHRQMQDALELFSKDSQAGEAAMRQNAMKFGDQKALVMLDHGMVPELVQYYGSFGQAMTQLTKADEDLTKSKFKQQMFTNMGGNLDAFTAVYLGDKYKDPGAQMIMRSAFQDEQKASDGKPIDGAGYERIANKVKTFSEKMAGLTGAERETFQKIYVENHMKRKEDGSPAMSEGEAMEDALRRTSTAMRPNQSPERTFIDEYYAAHPEATPEEFSKAFGDFKAGQHRPGGSTGGPGAARVQTMEEIKADIKREHPDWTAGKVDLEAIRQARTAAASPITGNERVKQESHIEQYRLAIHDIDEVETLIKKHTGAVGAAGYVGRVGERLSNLVGSNATDREQLERIIHQLKLTAPRLLLDATGRPLSAEAEHINKIVAGLNLGDTTANTLRAMKELKERFATMRDAASNRIGEGGAATPKAGWTVPPSQRITE